MFSIEINIFRLEYKKSQNFAACKKHTTPAKKDTDWIYKMEKIFHAINLKLRSNNTQGKITQKT